MIKIYDNEVARREGILKHFRQKFFMSNPDDWEQLAQKATEKYLKEHPADNTTQITTEETLPEVVITADKNGNIKSNINYGKDNWTSELSIEDQKELAKRDMNIHYNDNRARMIDYLWQNGGKDPVTGKVWDNSYSRAQKAATAAVAGTLGLVGGIGTGILPAMVESPIKGFNWFNTTLLGRAADTGLGVAGIVHAAGDNGIKKTVRLAKQGETDKAILSGVGDALDLFGGAISGLNVGNDIYKVVKGGAKGILSGLHPALTKTKNGWSFGRTEKDWNHWKNYFKNVQRKAKRNYNLGDLHNQELFFNHYKYPVQYLTQAEQDKYLTFINGFYKSTQVPRVLKPVNLKKIPESQLKRALLIRGVDPADVNRLRFVKTPDGYDIRANTNVFSDLNSGVNYQMRDYQNPNNIVQGVLKIPENPTSNYKFVVPEDYKNIIQKNTQYVIDFFDGKFKPFGSSVGVAKVNFPHDVHDIDGAMTYVDFVKWKYAHPKVPVKQKTADTYGVMVNGNEIDVNVLRVDGDRTYELYRQFFPEQYSKAVTDFIDAGYKGKLSDYIDIIPKQAFSEIDPALKTIVDSFEIDPFQPNKIKHLVRPLKYLTFGEPKIVETALQKFAKTIGGTERFPATLDQLTDVQHNVEILKQIGYPKDAVNLLAADPQRMRNALDYWYLQKTIQMRGVSGSNNKVVNKALREWLGENNTGGSAHGAGLNAVRYGNSSYGPIAGYSQIHSNVPISLNLSLEDKINAINRFTGSSDYRLTPGDITAIKFEAMRAGLNANSFEKCNTFGDVLSQIPVTNSGQKFLQALGKKLNIQTLEGKGMFNKGQYVSFTQDLKPEHYIPLKFTKDLSLVGTKRRLEYINEDINLEQIISKVKEPNLRMEGFRSKDKLYDHSLNNLLPEQYRAPSVSDKTFAAVYDIPYKRVAERNRRVYERVDKMFNRFRRNRNIVNFLTDRYLYAGIAGVGSVGGILSATNKIYNAKETTNKQQRERERQAVEKFCKKNNIEFNKLSYYQDDDPFMKFIKQKYNISNSRKAFKEFIKEYVK